MEKIYLKLNPLGMRRIVTHPVEREPAVVLAAQKAAPQTVEPKEVPEALENRLEEHKEVADQGVPERMEEKMAEVRGDQVRERTVVQEAKEPVDREVRQGGQEKLKDPALVPEMAAATKTDQEVEAAVCGTHFQHGPK